MKPAVWQRLSLTIRLRFGKCIRRERQDAAREWQQNALTGYGAHRNPKDANGRLCYCASMLAPKQAQVLYKLGDGKPEDRLWMYQDVWAVEELLGTKRLVIAPKSGTLDILERLIEMMPEPFWLLYVLVVPRGEGGAGRYQTSEPQTLEQVRRFLHEFQAFLEADGRQNLWIRSDSSSTTLINDRHGLIYGYGLLHDWEVILKQTGLSEVPSASIKIPDPHSHHYHASLDVEASRLLAYLEWHHTPLRDEDLQ
jgi:hypothetical protein